MEAFKTARGEFIIIDDVITKGAPQKVIKADLQQQKDELQARIATADPNQPQTKDAWAEWGKAHYPYVNHQAEVEELARVQSILEAIREL